MCYNVNGKTATIGDIKYVEIGQFSNKLSKW